MERDSQTPEDIANHATSPDIFHAVAEGNQLLFQSPQAAYDMLLDLYLQANNDPSIPRPVAETIHTVSLAFGFLAYDHLRPSKQAIFLSRLQHERENLHIEKTALTMDEALVLQRIAQSVNLDYDPGSDDTPDQRIFPFSSVEARPPEDLSWYTTMTGRATPPEHDPIIVESTPPTTSTES